MKSIRVPPEHALEFSSISVDKALNWLRLTNQLIHLQFDNFSSHSPDPGMRGEMVPLQPLFDKF
jgi:hypothetical protein